MSRNIPSRPDAPFSIPFIEKNTKIAEQVYNACLNVFNDTIAY